MFFYEIKNTPGKVFWMNDLFFFCVFFVIKANENVGPIRLADVICNHSQNQRVERFKDPLDGVTTQRSLGGHRAPIKMERCHCSLGCWFNFSSSHSHSTRVLWLSLGSFFRHAFHLRWVVSLPSPFLMQNDVCFCFCSCHFWLILVCVLCLREEN